MGRGEKKKAYVHIVVDRYIKSANALKKADFKVTVEDVILMEMANKPGEMQEVAEKIADAGIDILYNYGSAGSGRTNFCVLKTDDDKKAIKVIQAK